MDNQYEHIDYMDELPVQTYLSSVSSTRLHWHQEMEIILVVKGSMRAQVQNVMHHLREGELLVISPNQIHATHQTEDANTILVLQFKCSKFGHQDTPLDSIVFDCVGDPSSHPHMAALRSHVCTVMLEIIYKQTGYAHVVEASIQSMLGLLLRHFPYKHETTLESLRPKDHDRMSRIFAYVNQHYAQRITLAELAEQEYLTPNHLSTLIRRSIGMCFGDYVNAVRLKAYLERLQTDMTTPLDILADQCGFSSPQYASALFQKTHHVTPGKYRKQMHRKESVRKNAIDSVEGDAFAAVYQPSDLTGLLHQWQQDSIIAEAIPQAPEAPAAMLLPIDAHASLGRHHRSCTRIAAIGRAYEGLLSHVQATLRMAQQQIGFTYLRFHGIFSDDMMILKVDNMGALHYSWRLVDALIDFLLSIGLRPFFELTYMPTLLASGPETAFAWRANITPPSSLDAWGALVRSFVRHCVARYGMDEVSEWGFEVWNEPDYRGVSWTGTEQEFFRFFAETARILRAECPRARICGPSVSSRGVSRRHWAPAFAEYCLRNDVPVDVVTLHAYPEILESENLYGQLQEIIEQRDTNLTAEAMRGPAYVQEHVDMLRKQLERFPQLPVVITEWGLTLAAYSPINDSPFAATAMLYTALSCDAENVHAAYWTLTDYMEEQYSLPPQELHGGFGLITVSGVRKPTFWAMWMLSRLGHELVARMEGGVITRAGGQWQLLAFHHPATERACDMTYARQYRQDVPHQGDMLCQTWRLEGLSGRYRIRRALFDVARCDAKTLAFAQGLPEIPDTEDAAYLTQIAQPIRSEYEVDVAPGEGLAVTFRLGLCDFELVNIAPV